MWETGGGEKEMWGKRKVVEYTYSSVCVMMIETCLCNHSTPSIAISNHFYSTFFTIDAPYLFLICAHHCFCRWQTLVALR
jgi:hypothetical protein